MSDNAIKVVIVGGGCAGLATAWQLSKVNEARRAAMSAGNGAQVTYDITVYEQSSRLGGKGASSRDEHGRILEHGLHVWMGFYENAFRMMRECYREVETNHWGPRAGGSDGRLTHESFDGAFIPEPHLGVAVKRRSGELQFWSGYFPPMPGQPGEPLDIETNPFTLRGYMTRALGLTRALLQSVLAPATGVAEPGEPRPNDRSTFDEAVERDFDFDPLQSPEILVDRATRLLRIGSLTTAAGLLQAVTILECWIRERSPDAIRQMSVVKFVEAVVTQARRQLQDLVTVDEEMRCKTEIIDLLMTITVGLYRDRVLFSKQGLDAINDIDYRQWLLKHGATTSSVESAFVTGIYDLVFAYRRGDRNRPALAAGQALRGALRMFFTYRGAMFWRLGSGMGDAVFAPLYRVLEKRGVKFRFERDLTAVTFDKAEPSSELEGSRAGSRRVATLTFKEPDKPIADPLDPRGCWPVPRDAEKQRPLVLHQATEHSCGDDSFDVVVFATGINRFRELCQAGLCSDVKAWRDMCDRVRTVGTVSAQVWLDRDLEQLGWLRGSAMVSAFDGQFNTWADMSRLLPSEAEHRGSSDRHGKARSLAYFCGVLPDVNPPSEQSLRIALDTLLRDGLRRVWPSAYSSDGAHTPVDRLVSKDGSMTGTVGDQFISRNVDNSNKYTLSLPGSLAYRISPLDNTVANMTIAGDWTECGFNAGCVEAAVMSGMLAAHAISGYPELNAIVGYNHP